MRDFAREELFATQEALDLSARGPRNRARLDNDDRMYSKSMLHADALTDRLDYRMSRMPLPELVVRVSTAAR